jgi:ArsR family transcriptional regulator
MGHSRVLRRPVRKRRLADDAAFFRALSDANRLKIIAVLARAREPMNFGALAQALPVHESSVSYHLALLKNVGIVVGERRGNWGFYQIAPDMRAHLASTLEALLCESWGPRTAS